MWAHREERDEILAEETLWNVGNSRESKGHHAESNDKDRNSNVHDELVV